MPAFHRMPITYVVLILVGTSWLVWSKLSGGRGPTPNAEPSVAVSAEPSPANPPEAVAAAPAAPAPGPAAPDLILRTADGLRRKVVVTELGVAPRSGPNGATTGKPLDYLAIRYVFEESPTGYRIGKGETPDGWIPKESALEWDTRLMARPTPRAGRPPLVVYQDEACLAHSLSKRPCPNHRRACPIVGEETGTADPGAGSVLGWPVLSTRTVKAADGTDVDLLEVAPLVDDKAPPPSEPPAELRPALKTVYIAFVVDTTASMQATIDSVRDVAGRLTLDAGKRYADVTLRLGLVSYRDMSPAFGHVARVESRFAPPDRFLKALASLEAAKKGDGSVDESVFEGIATAFPGGDDRLDWPTGRDGALATKLMILLGDAPDHARDLTRARSLAATARREGITIAAVSIRSATQLTKSERTRYESQWRTLAEESYRPPDRREAFAKPIPAQLLSLDQVSTWSETLVTLIDARVEAARVRAALAAAEAEGRLENYVNSQGLTSEQVAPVLKDLHRDGAAAGRTNLNHDGKKAPTVRRGWIPRRIGGAETATLEMLLGLDELDALILEFTAVQQAARASSEELGRLVEFGNAAAAGETSFLARDRGARTFADHLKRRQGVAPTRKDSLLARSRTDFLRADEIDRAALDKKLGESLLNLARRRDSADWRTPGKTFEGKALVPFAWIDF